MRGTPCISDSQLGYGVQKRRALTGGITESKTELTCLGNAGALGPGMDPIARATPFVGSVLRAGYRQLPQDIGSGRGGWRGHMLLEQHLKER
jgi:hypothetical protein